MRARWVFRRRCSSGICRQRRRSAPWRSVTRPFSDRRPGRISSAATHRRRTHVEGLPLGTRGGVLAPHTFPLDGDYVIKADLLETNLGAVRGLIEPHQVEFSIDGERVFVASVGGDADNAKSAANPADMIADLEQRLTVRVTVKAGPRVVGAAFVKRSSAQGGSKLQPILRSTIDSGDHTGLPHVDEPDHHRAVRRHGARRYTEPSSNLLLPTVERGGRIGVREPDPVEAGLPRLSPPRDRARSSIVCSRSIEAAGSRERSRPVSSSDCGVSSPTRSSCFARKPSL